MPNPIAVAGLKILEIIVKRFFDPEQVKQAYLNSITKGNHKALELAEEHFLNLDKRIIRVMELSQKKSGNREKRELSRLLMRISEDKKDFFQFKRSP